jgi:hypothetical protein
VQAVTPWHAATTANRDSLPSGQHGPRTSVGLRLKKLLESQRGESLQEWDELERETTRGRGTAADFIRDARRNDRRTPAHVSWWLWVIPISAAGNLSERCVTSRRR